MESFPRDFFVVQMFGLLVNLTGTDFAPAPKLIYSWRKPPVTHEPYSYIIENDGKDGVRFKKPSRGHEDGCVMGVCAEHVAGLLHPPMHKPVP
jgi:hypothetical protein